MSKIKLFVSSIAILMILLPPFGAVAQNTGGKVEVSGLVLDENGEPLPGAVIVATTKAGENRESAMSDIDGAYKIVCSADNVLVFHYIGYDEMKLGIPAKGGRLDCRLVPSKALALDEAVVIGYGSVKKSDLTGSVVDVKMGDIRDVPVTSVDKALQGRVAGADFMSTSGEPGATTTVRIRGTRSVNASNEPLYVVDGVLDAISDLNDINPADIESVTVLKDASSTAIYGARGSNGVVIVTTKSGLKTSGKPQVTLKADAGVSMLPATLDLMDAREFSLYRNDVVTFSANAANEKYTIQTPTSSLKHTDPMAAGQGTDWIREVTRVAVYQNYNLSVNSGTEQTTYYASLGYNNSEGIIRNSGMEKYNGRLNISHNLFKWLKVGYKLNYSYRHNDETLGNIGGTSYKDAAMYLSPMMSTFDDFNPIYDDGNKINPPTATIAQNTYYTDRHSTNHTMSADVKFNKYLTFRSQFSYYLFERHRYRYYPSALPKKTSGEGGDAYRAEYNQNKEEIDNTLTYDRTWRKTHHLDLMGGFVASTSRTNTFTLSGSGYMVDNNLWNNLGAVTDKNTYSATSGTTKVVTESFIARANYNYKKRYYFTLTGRYDGASNFAADNKWGFFPSAAFRWNIAREPFMKKHRNVEELSLRLSAGRTGNDAISAYQSFVTLTSTTGGYLFSGQQPAAFYQGKIDSPYLTWEKTDTYNAALKGSFYRGRLKFDADVYFSKTTDLLLSIQTPAQTGYTSRLANLGETTNKGVELSIETRNIVREDFSWTTSFTFSANRQKVVDVGTEDRVVAYNSPGNNPFMMYGYKVGYPLNAVWGFKYMGVWHNDEEIKRNEITKSYASMAIKLGAPKYMDLNNDGQLGQEDLCYLGNSDPAFYGGLQNSFTFGPFNLGIYFTYSVGGKIYNFAEIYMSGGNNTNQYRYMLQAWHPERNPESDYPMAGVEGKDLLPSSFMVHDASFLRLQDVTFGYNIPMPKCRFIKDINLSVSGNNLLLWKNYNGFDPDVSSSGTSSTLRRLDIGAYPKARTIIFSIQVRY